MTRPEARKAALGVAFAVVSLLCAATVMQALEAKVYFASTNDALFRAYVGDRLLTWVVPAIALVVVAAGAWWGARRALPAAICLAAALAVLGWAQRDARERLRWVDRPRDVLADFPAPAGTTESVIGKGVDPGPDQLRIWDATSPYSRLCAETAAAFRAWADAAQVDTAGRCDGTGRRGELVVTMSVRQVAPGRTTAVVTARPPYGPR